MDIAYNYFKYQIFHNALYFYNPSLRLQSNVLHLNVLAYEICPNL